MDTQRGSGALVPVSSIVRAEPVAWPEFPADTALQAFRAGASKRERPLRVLSLGAGLQSTVVLLMSCLGELPRLDAAVFADTAWEPRAVYEHLDWLRRYAWTEAGIPVFVVSKGDIRADTLRAKMRGLVGEGSRAASMPFYSKDSSGKVGMIKRQCTKEYKIEPVNREIKRLVGLKPRDRWPVDLAVEVWFGITVDEQRRMRISADRWKTHRYPLVFDLPRPYRREHCEQWLTARGFNHAPRSACVGCPFRSNAEWRRLQVENPAEWADAVAFDREIRSKGGHRGELYLHRSALPLDAVDLSTAEERGQQTLGVGMAQECLGYCGA